MAPDESLINTKKDELTIAIKGLTDLTQQLVQAYAAQMQVIEQPHHPPEGGGRDDQGRQRARPSRQACPAPEGEPPRAMTPCGCMHGSYFQIRTWMEIHMNDVSHGKTRRAFLAGHRGGLAVPLFLTARKSAAATLPVVLPRARPPRPGRVYPARRRRPAPRPSTPSIPPRPEAANTGRGRSGPGVAPTLSRTHQ